jgi:ABC-2 type transport system ATP-binding protein
MIHAMNIIETHDLSVRYGHTEALRSLNLTVPSGSVFALLGANGAGKTTAIKVLVNLLRPTAGIATVLGTDSRKLSPAQFEQIGYVSENQELPGWMTVRQLLDFCRPFYPTWDRDLERTLLKALDLPEDRKLKNLSRGMFMKASLLSSLAYRPKLLVLDEPFSGLDALVREEFVHGLLEVFGSGEWTILISSHDIEEIERLAGTVGVIDEGRLQSSESIESLLGRFRRIEGTLGSDNGNLTPPEGVLEWQRDGTFVRFVETAYTTDKLDDLQKGVLPGALLQARPMTLREIFVSQARNSRANSRRISS